MPKAPPRPCTHPGCPAHATHGSKCERHKPKAWASTVGSAHSRGYGAEWRRLRRYKLNRNPVCEYCGEAIATEVDHHTPKARGGTDDYDNLRATCEGCHTAKTLREAADARHGS